MSTRNVWCKFNLKEEKEMFKKNNEIADHFNQRYTSN